MKYKKIAAFLLLIAAAVLLSACGTARNITGPIDTEKEAASDFTNTEPSNKAAAVEILSAITVDGVSLYQGEFTGDGFFVDGARIVLTNEEPTTYTITDSLTIPGDCALVVEDGSTMTFAPGSVLTVEEGGTFFNLGSLMIGSSHFSLHGELVNDIIMIENPGEVPYPEAQGTIVVEEGGILSVSKTGSLINMGILCNGQEIWMEDTEDWQIVKGGEVIVYGELISENNMINYGTLTVAEGGRLENNWNLYSFDTITVESGAALSFKGDEFVSEGLIDTYGVFKVLGGTLYLSGTLNVMAGDTVIDGKISPEGNNITIKIKEGTVFSAPGNVPKEPGIYQFINGSWKKGY